MRLSHIGWNLAGLSLPLAVAALTVPHLIDKLGHERFGFVALAWGLIGYAGALDLGLGRALTQMVARMQGDGEFASIPNVLATAGRITLMTGLVGGTLIALGALTAGPNWIKSESASVNEIQISILLLAIALPAQAMSATYRGLNEAFLNFKGISLLRAALGVVNFAGPYVVSLMTIQLPWIIATLVISRVLALFAYRRLAIICLREALEIRGKAAYSPDIARALFSFGGWVTVSSVISPILVQADRFMIAFAISIAAVSIYVLPYEIVVQSLILVGAISSVIFPGLSKLIREEPDGWQAYFRKWLVRVAVLMAFSCVGLVLLLPIILPLWIKDNFDQQSVFVGQVLCLGVFANSLGSMFYAVLHAQGRADLTAKIHLFELPIFLAALFWATTSIGVAGAAWAWTGRMIFDLFALAWQVRRLSDAKRLHDQRGIVNL
jgi:O-antigen/teichoic acid export membrane protein